MTRTIMIAAALLTAPVHALDMDFFEKLVAIPSVSDDAAEVNKATRLMRDYLEKRAVHCTIEKMDSGREVLYAATTPGKRHDYVMSVHLDVVAPGAPDHFKMKRKGDRVEGRGVSDCKGYALGAKGGGAHAVNEHAYISSLDGITGYLVKFFLEAGAGR